MDTIDETRVMPLAEILDPPPASDDSRGHRWNAARIPMSHRFTTLTDLTDVPRPVIERAQQFVLSWHSRHQPETAPESDFPADKVLLGQGLLLAGMSGHGKTSVACAMAQEVSLTYNVGILFAPMADYVRALGLQFSAKDQPAMQRGLSEAVAMLQRCADVPLLILDDVGKEHITASGVAKDEFDRLVRARKRRALPTIVTTNMGLETWQGAYGKAMTSFIYEAFPPIVVDSGRDLRKGRPA